MSEFDLSLPPHDPLTPHVRTVLDRHGLILTPPPPSSRRKDQLQRVNRAALLPLPQAIPALASLLVYDTALEVRQAASYRLRDLDHPLADLALVLGLLAPTSLAQDTQGYLPQRRPVVVELLIALYQDRRIREDVFCPIVAELAENQPSVEVRMALPHLKHPPLTLFPGAETRAALQEAIARIEAATGALRDLPLVADTTPKRDDLPLPAQELPDA